ALPGYAAVVRADDKEAEMLLGVPPGEMRDAARKLLERGPRLIAVAVDDGNLFVLDDGHVHVPHTGDGVGDPPGGGGVFVAALPASLLRGEPYREAARRATAASG